jgi:hypothetical protein
LSLPISSDPIQDATASTVACNDDGTSPSGQLTATNVPAGSKITAYWNQVWPHPYGPMVSTLKFSHSEYRLNELSLIVGLSRKMPWLDMYRCQRKVSGLGMLILRIHPLTTMLNCHDTSSKSMNQD